MKKIFFSLLFSTASIIGFSQTEKAVYSVNCGCPGGWGSCNASCWFSDCCICYDPGVSDGACGCYFGIAKCNSAKKGQAAKTISDAGASIAFDFVKFSGFIVYLIESKFDVSKLTGGFSLFKSKYPAVAGKVQVKALDYIEFEKVYTGFIEPLTAEQKGKINTYINKQ